MGYGPQTVFIFLILLAHFTSATFSSLDFQPPTSLLRRRRRFSFPVGDSSLFPPPFGAVFLSAPVLWTLVAVQPLAPVRVDATVTRRIHRRPWFQHGVQGERHFDTFSTVLPCFHCQNSTQYLCVNSNSLNDVLSAVSQLKWNFIIFCYKFSCWHTVICLNDDDQEGWESITYSFFRQSVYFVKWCLLVVCFLMLIDIGLMSMFGLKFTKLSLC